MNKLLVILAIVTVLGLGGMFVAKRSSKTTPTPTPASSYQPSTATSPAPPPAGGSAATKVTTTSKTELDSNLGKELDQLDQDVTKGSEETLTDSDLNIQ